jgi:hypothetical protein
VGFGASLAAGFEISFAFRLRAAFSGVLKIALAFGLVRKCAPSAPR